jgi:hypothetical protein
MNCLPAAFGGICKQEGDKPLDLSCLVDQTLRISNLRFLEGLQEIQAFFLVVCCRYSGAYKMAGSRSAIKEGDLEPMCFQLIDFQMVAKLTVPGPFQPHRTLCETGTKKRKNLSIFPW